MVLKMGPAEISLFYFFLLTGKLPYEMIEFSVHCVV